MVSCLGVLLPPSSGAASPTRDGGADHPRGGDGGSGGGMWREGVKRRTGRTGSASTGTSSHSGSASRSSKGRSRCRRLRGVRDRRASLAGAASIDTCLWPGWMRRSATFFHAFLVQSLRIFLRACPRTFLVPLFFCHLVKELVRETGDRHPLVLLAARQMLCQRLATVLARRPVRICHRLGRLDLGLPILHRRSPALPAFRHITAFSVTFAPTTYVRRRPATTTLVVT